MQEHLFQQKYHEVLTQWNKKYGWDLFLPLSPEDQYNLETIHIPLTNSQPEFDQLVLCIVKSLIDSLNESVLQKNIGNEQNQKGIAKLESWFQQNSFEGYEEHIQFLRNLQELRSTGSGHRKGQSYQKITQKMGIDLKLLVDSFESILIRANAFLDYLLTSI